MTEVGREALEGLGRRLEIALSSCSLPSTVGVADLYVQSPPAIHALVRSQLRWPLGSFWWPAILLPWFSGAFCSRRELTCGFSKALSVADA